MRRLSVHQGSGHWRINNMVHHEAIRVFGPCGSFFVHLLEKA
jgi:hypothetical protein